MTPPGSSADAGALAALARRADPADPGAQNNLGVVLLARGQRAGAAAAFSRALALDPRMALARRNLDAADGDEWRARRIAELRARLRVDGSDIDARRELAPLLADAGRLDEARRELDTLCAQSPADPGPCLRRALHEQHAGDLVAAEDWLLRAIERDPRSALAHTHLGEVRYHRGEPQRALAALDDALALAPAHAEAHLARGFVLGELGRTDEAAAATARALVISPMLGRAESNLVAGTPRLVTAEPDDVPAPAPLAGSGSDVHFALGTAFRQKGYFDEALREYRRALVRGGAEEAAVRALGELQLLRGDPVASLRHFARLTALRPDDPSAWHGRAVAEHLGGDVEAAQTAYRQGLACAAPSGGERARLLNDLGVLLAAQGRGDEATERLAAAVAAAPTLRIARLNHAQLLATLGRADHAVAAYRAVLRTAPDDASAWAGLGAVLAAGGRHAEARTALARALELEPTRADARYELGFLAASIGDHDAALRETTHALVDAPFVPRRALALAVDLGAGSEHASGFRDVVLPGVPNGAFVVGFELPPDALSALLGETLAPAPRADDVTPSPVGTSAYIVATECLRAGLYERAAAAVTAALARGAPRAAGLTLLADVFVAQGFHGEALERYAEAATLEPAAREARLGELRMLRETGRRAPARAAAESLLRDHGSDASVLALGSLARIDDDDVDGGRTAAERAAGVASEIDEWALVAAAWRALGERDAEIAACGRALTVSPEHGPTRLTLARALVATGRATEAADVLRQLVAASSTGAEARLDLASLLASAGKRTEARGLLVDVLETDPLHLDALSALAALLVDDERDTDARVAVARVLRFDAGHAHALAVTGDLLARGGRMPEARAHWHRAMRDEPVGDGAARARASLARHGE